MMLCTFGAEDDRWSTMLPWDFEGISIPCDSFLQNNKILQSNLKTSKWAHLQISTAYRLGLLSLYKFS